MSKSTTYSTPTTGLGETIYHILYAQFAKLAENLVLSVLGKIEHGSLKITTAEVTYCFPRLGAATLEAEVNEQNQVQLGVTNSAFWIRMLTMGDLGFAESYMYGDVECENLTGLFSIFLANRENISNMNSVISPLFSLVSRVSQLRFVNSISNTKSNISAHYDISNTMFQAFLSEDMTYSCAIFEDLDGDLQKPCTNSPISEPKFAIGKPVTSGTPPPPYTSSPITGKDELHAAQVRKLMHVLRKAAVCENHRLLEIGSGWGSFAILAVQMTGCTIDTITLSQQQQEFARRRIAALGLEEKIHVHLMDYRNMPSDWKGKFDRVVSIEMVEAVGKEFLSEYFKVLDWALKPQGGVAVIQSITIPEARYQRYIKEVDFIRKWIFPGGILPTVTSMIDAVLEGSSGRLVCESLDNIGPHYARTLRAWRTRFEAVFDSAIAPALLVEYPAISFGKQAKYELEVFKRKWIYYFIYCEIGFTKRILGDHIFVLLREGAETYSRVPCH